MIIIIMVVRAGVIIIIIIIIMAKAITTPVTLIRFTHEAGRPPQQGPQQHGSEPRIYRNPA
jgi:hypothetical protein